MKNMALNDVASFIMSWSDAAMFFISTITLCVALSHFLMERATSFGCGCCCSAGDVGKLCDDSNAFVFESSR